MHIDKSRKSFYNFFNTSGIYIIKCLTEAVWLGNRKDRIQHHREVLAATTATVKKAAEEAVEEVKAAAKKTPVKKTAAKKVAEPKTSVHFQYNGKDLAAKEVLAAAMEHFKENHKDTAVREFELYIVAEENAAYYVVNGEPSDDYKILL